VFAERNSLHFYEKPIDTDPLMEVESLVDADSIGLITQLKVLTGFGPENGAELGNFGMVLPNG
jgi:hypothetical protein